MTFEKESLIQQMLIEIKDDYAGTSRYTGLSKPSQCLLDAMLSVPRHEFVPDGIKECAYVNHAVPIDCGQTISQPYIVALMTELLAAKPDYTILEIGTGSGYQAAVLSKLVKKVYSVEIIPELAEQAASRLKRLGFANIESIAGDGYHGLSEHAPYDGIIVTAAAKQVPQPLIDQLKSGARMVVPVGYPHLPQQLYLLQKDQNGVVSQQSVLSVAFVPLTGGH